MDDVARQPGLVRRSARWYLRSRVPVGLVRFLGRDEIWRSLRTGDHAVAVKHFRRARADLDDWFDAQRRRRDAGERLAGEVPRLVSSWFHEHERKASHRDFGLFGDLLHDALGETDHELCDLLDGGAEETVQAAVDQVLVANGWPGRAHTVGSIQTKKRCVADAPDEHRAALAEMVRRALIEAARRRRERLRGSPNGVSFDPLFSNGAAVHPAPENGPDTAGITLAGLIERFEAAKLSRLSPGKVTEYQALFRLLKELWGEHKPVRAIDRAACRQVLDLVEVLPPHATKRFPKLTLAQAAEQAKANSLAPMDPATANAYLQRLSTMLRWAEREEYVTRNAAVGLRVSTPEDDPRYARDPFSLDQLKKIFSTPLYTGCRNDERGYAIPGPNVIRRARFWIPLLALFTGCRINELCGLATEDVTEQDGVHVLVIRPDADAGRRLKTANAKRTIPLHGELVRCGFLEFVARQRKAGHDRLFVELKQDSRGRFADATDKWFNDRDRFLDKAGALAPKTSFHSFRHSFTDALRRAGATGEVIDGLCGWARGNMRDRYGSGPWILMLADVMQRVEYDGLDLSHLHVR